METKYKIAHSENNDEISVLNELLSQFQAKFGEVVDKINQLHAST